MVRDVLIVAIILEAISLIAVNIYCIYCGDNCNAA